MAVQYSPEFLRHCAARANQKMMNLFAQEIPSLLVRVNDGRSELGRNFQMSAELQDYLNGSFIDRMGGIYSSEERKFILDVSRQFERVKLGFAYFGLIDSQGAAEHAVRLAEKQLRTGFVKTGYPIEKIQTIGRHHRGTKELGFKLFFDDENAHLIEEIGEFHDVGEAVIGDFTPNCAISKSDKARIEALAVRLITRSRVDGDEFSLSGKIYKAISLYDGDDEQFADVRGKVKDCDLLEMCTESIRMMATAPQQDRADINIKLQDFWDYVGDHLKTDRAKNFFESIQVWRRTLDLTPSDPVEIFEHAHQSMLFKSGGSLGPYDHYLMAVQLRSQNHRVWPSEITL